VDVNTSFALTGHSNVVQSFRNHPATLPGERPYKNHASSLDIQVLASTGIAHLRPYCLYSDPLEARNVSLCFCPDLTSRLFYRLFIISAQLYLSSRNLSPVNPPSPSLCFPVDSPLLWHRSRASIIRLSSGRLSPASAFRKLTTPRVCRYFFSRSSLDLGSRYCPPDSSGVHTHARTVLFLPYCSTLFRDRLGQFSVLCPVPLSLASFLLISPSIVRRNGPRLRLSRQFLVSPPFAPLQSSTLHRQTDPLSCTAKGDQESPLYIQYDLDSFTETPTPARD
jgi:hypothetical protein